MRKFARNVERYNPLRTGAGANGNFNIENAYNYSINGTNKYDGNVLSPSNDLTQILSDEKSIPKQISSSLSDVGTKYVQTINNAIDKVAGPASNTEQFAINSKINEAFGRSSGSSYRMGIPIFENSYGNKRFGAELPQASNYFNNNSRANSGDYLSNDQNSQVAASLTPNGTSTSSVTTNVEYDPETEIDDINTPPEEQAQELVNNMSDMETTGETVNQEPPADYVSGPPTETNTPNVTEVPPSDMETTNMTGTESTGDVTDTGSMDDTGDAGDMSETGNTDDVGDMSETAESTESTTPPTENPEESTSVIEETIDQVEKFLCETFGKKEKFCDENWHSIAISVIIVIALVFIAMAIIAFTSIWKLTKCLACKDCCNKDSGFKSSSPSTSFSTSTPSFSSSSSSSSPSTSFSTDSSSTFSGGNDDMIF